MTAAIELNKIYQGLVRFKLIDNPDKTYNRVTRSKKIGGLSSGGMRRKLKHLINTDLPPLTVIPTLQDMPTSPKSSIEFADITNDNMSLNHTLSSTLSSTLPLLDDESQPNNIVILKNTEYDKIKTTKYNLNDLRLLCGHYGIKKSGTKPELVSRIYLHLKQSSLVFKIQRKFRRHIAIKYSKLNGPAFLKAKQCVNDTDFYTFDKLTDIEPHTLFSFLDEDGKIYGFHIASIYNLIITSYPDITNPYNRNIIPISVIQNVYEKLIYGSLLNVKVSIKLDEDEDTTVDKISPEKQEELFIVGLFQHINTLGNYSDSEWFMVLRRNDYLRFIRHIYDIWSYRANLTYEVKEQICPPNGNPFMLNNSYININIVNLLSESELRTICVSIIERMVKRGASREDQCLGAFYVLATLTIVNQNARDALPWLYEAVL